MFVNDAAYGENEVSEPIVLELLETRAMQRLKGINQYGTWKFFDPKFSTSRLDHSVGVFLLLRRFNAPIEEQVAGLIHDVNHGVFSHVIDYVYGQPEKQEWHEELKERVIMESDIPDVLERHGLDIKKVIDENNFPLLEKPLPDLCADRLDYFFRDSVLVGICSKDDVDFFLEHLIIHDNEFVVDGFEAGNRMALAYLECADKFWGPPLQAASFWILADAIKKALESGILKREDLLTEDDLVFEKLKKSGEKEILEKISLLNPNLRVVEDGKNYDYFVRSKARFIDPKMLLKGKLTRVSEEDKDLKKSIEYHRKRIERGYNVRLC